MFLGIEIGGTKLQLGVGPGDGTLTALVREPVDPAAGAAGIRAQILAAVGRLDRAPLQGVGIGFGGPVDDHRQCTIKSHQIAGWDEFPLAAWCEEELGIPARLGNDADLAGLAEAKFGAGRGLDPVLYMTIGSGIGGGLIIAGRIHRGTGLGAAEIGHLRMHTPNGVATLEDLCSGWSLERRSGLPMRELAERYHRGDGEARQLLNDAWSHLADALCHVIALVCPARIVIGGGVALLGDQLFDPLKTLVAERVFRPFAGSYEIVPAALAEEVVVHGALALARESNADYY
jgi:glucokinase